MSFPKKYPNFLAELDAVHADTMALLMKRAAELTKQPGPGKWSALQCIDHVVRTNQAYIGLIRNGARDAIARRRLATRPFKYGWLERIVIWAVEPPPRIHVQTPSPAVDPAPELDVEAVREAYEHMYEEFRRCLQEATTANLRKVRISSPFARRIGGDAVGVIGVLLAHERRHLYQARKAAAKYPS
jgi:hypothetical protein